MSFETNTNLERTPLVTEAEIVEQLFACREIVQKVSRDEYPLHVYAAERYLNAYDVRDGKLLIANDDTRLGQQLCQMIETASVPAKQYFVASNDPRIKDVAGSRERFAVEYERLYDQEPIHIPAKSFVAASGFEGDWSQGRGPGQEKVEEGTRDKYESSVLIARYAQMPASTAPAVTGVFGYRQPNGMIIYQSRDAHRTAAAIMRGDETIAVKSVRIYDIDDQIIS